MDLAWTDGASDPKRRMAAKVPQDVTFKTKPEIALDQVRAVRAAGVTPEVPTRSGRGRKPTRLRGPGDGAQPVQVPALADNRNWGSAMTKAGDGSDSTTMRPYASPPEIPCLRGGRPSMKTLEHQTAQTDESVSEGESD